MARALQVFGQAAEHGRHEFGGVDALGLDQRGQAVGLGQHVLRADHQRGTGGQRADEVAAVDVETAGRHLQVALQGVQRVGALPAQVGIDGVAVRHQHTLGATRGARGEDDVGPGLGGDVQPQVVGRPGAQLGRVDVQAQQGQAGFGQRGAVGLVADGGLGLHVLQHRGQARGRVGRVQRHEGAAGFQHRQHGLYLGRPARQAHRHRAAWRRAACEQRAGQAVGAGVELAVGEPAAVQPHRVGLRLRGDPCLDQRHQVARRQRLRGRERGRGAHGGQAGVIEQRQRGQRRGRCGQRGAQPGLELARQALDSLPVEEVAAVFPQAAGAGRAFDDVQRQLELRAALVDVFIDHIEPGSAHRRHRVLVRVEHLEDGVAAGRALGAQRLDDFVEGQRGVREGGQAGVSHLRHQCGETGLRRHAHADGQGVDEDADHAGQAGLVASGHGRADQQFVLAGVARQHGGQGGQAHRVGRGLLLAGEALDAFVQRWRQRVLHQRAAVAGRGGARAIGRQLQHRQRALQLRLPVAQFAFVRGGVELAGLPGHVVAVLQRWFGQRRGTRSGQREQLAHEDTQRPAVEDDVVEAQGQQPAAVGAACQHGAPAGAGAQVQRRLDGFTREVRLLRGIGQHLRVLLQLHQRQRCDALACACVAAVEGGAQDFVAAAHGVHRLRQARHVQRPAHTEDAGDVVGALVAAQFGQQPQPPLRQRQRGLGHGLAAGLGAPRGVRQHLVQAAALHGVELFDAGFQFTHDGWPW